MDSAFQFQEQRQEISLTPELIRSMEILQMPCQELSDYINSAAEENPVVEVERDGPGELRELIGKVSWLDSAPRYAGYGRDEERNAMEPGGTMDETEGLAFFLRSQLNTRTMDKRQFALVDYMIGLVDENGYLSQQDIDHITELGIPESMAEEAIRVIQSLEPPGVGARDLSECLTLQMERRGEGESVAARIAGGYLSELSKKQYALITKRLGVSRAEVERAEGVIRTLEPHPGRAFSDSGEVRYIIPDVYIAKADGTWQVVLNDSFLPRVTVSDYYMRMYTSTDDEEVKLYLREKIHNAKWLINCIGHRGQTLKKCAQQILASQMDWFEGTTTELAPMSLSQMAGALGVHVSTVSRAVREKYIQCVFGTFPVSYFFSHPVGFLGVSQQAIKQKLLALVRQEDPQHPLSDQKLSEYLLLDGVIVARRTVSKYREELGIGSTRARKKRG